MNKQIEQIYILWINFTTDHRPLGAVVSLARIKQFRSRHQFLDNRLAVPLVYSVLQQVYTRKI